jgi:hypothetical protein
MCGEKRGPDMHLNVKRREKVCASNRGSNWGMEQEGR